MKKPETVLREYVSRANDDVLKFVAGRLTQRLSGDVPDALNALSENHEMDRLLVSARTANDLYDLIDTVQDYADRELTKRYRDDAPRFDADEGNPASRRKRFAGTN